MAATENSIIRPKGGFSSAGHNWPTKQKIKLKWMKATPTVSGPPDHRQHVYQLEWLKLDQIIQHFVVDFIANVIYASWNKIPEM